MGELGRAAGLAGMCDDASLNSVLISGGRPYKFFVNIAYKTQLLHTKTNYLFLANLTLHPMNLGDLVINGYRPQYLLSLDVALAEL